jgi:hypothetical protein
MRPVLDLNVSVKVGSSSGASKRSGAVDGEAVGEDAVAVAVDGIGVGAAARTPAKDNERGSRVVMDEV